MTTRVTDQGGINGDLFDDGVNDYVRKVIVGECSQGITYIKIEYVRDGVVVEQEHGKKTGTQTQAEFEVNHPDEYITLIWGTIRDDYISESRIINIEDLDGLDLEELNPPLENFTIQTSRMDENPRSKFGVSELQLKTSCGRTSQVFGSPGLLSKAFKLKGKNGTKLVGLHGRFGDFLCSIGAHFIFVSGAFKQVKPHGGIVGDAWDDGVYDCVRKVRVGEDADRVTSVEFVYSNGDQLITYCHGKKLQERKEFVLDYENDEYIKSIEGFYDRYGFISSLTFKTSKDRDSEVFGKPNGTKFVIMAKGFDKLVGFRGRSYGNRVTSLGANFAVVVAPPVKKLEAKGGDPGCEEWDDGIHEGVYKIIVSREHSVVKAVKFEYVNGYADGQYQTVNGNDHVKIIPGDDIKEFKLCLGDEYITSVEGHYGQRLRLSGMARELIELIGFKYITMLKFKTNKGITYEALGNEEEDHEYVGESFVLGMEGHKIVGFHGKFAFDTVHQIGVYVKPIDNP
ncbi:PREDICTED: jacalin-related lectin 45-like [Camelina sativa]|uniref:Jacalin-related lectin 45-like n=1 Tax=Camelina sativa TaxID=90675 RepID=A0ABM0U0D3_CAMSA|nr:PREDICTED: jacalin-related lectin 45-like [Camelina sativa]